ncbi:uncharacterized protein LOC122243853, partial [Penaeus japonicus]|uniref:uncharacterized protein LOC122243853 n=1 Tax=Penaeus japonicus TaxID=27405 RepID=UPI001C70FAE0
MFIINIILTGVFHTLMLQVPPVPTNTLSFQCDSGGHRLVWGECDDCYDLRNNTQAALDIRFCKYDCDAPLEDLQMCLSNVNTTTCTSFNSTDKIHINGSLQVPGMEEGQPCFHSWREMQFEGNLYSNLTCNSACPMTCKVFGEKTCHEMLAKSAPPLTFWTYFVLRLIATFFLGSSFTMMDAVTLAQINKQGGEFGKQRVMTMVGFSIIPLIAGIIIDRIGEATGIIDYMPAFYLGDALLLLSVVLVSRLPLE